jgi:hypothetical protein
MILPNKLRSIYLRLKQKRKTNRIVSATRRRTTTTTSTVRSIYLQKLSTSSTSRKYPSKTSEVEVE